MRPIFSVVALLVLVSTSAVATEYPVVQVTILRDDEKLIESEIVIHSTGGQKFENIENLPYLVCAASVDGKHASAARHTIRDGASVTAFSTRDGISLSVVVETASGDVRTEPETCRTAPILPVIVSQRLNLPNDRLGVTTKLPGGVIVVARLIG